MITTMSPRRSILDAVLDLLRFDRGHSSFVVGEDGEWSHTATVVTIKMNKGETIDAFHARLRREFVQPGDTIDILNNGGKVDTARVTRRPH